MGIQTESCDLLEHGSMTLWAAEDYKALLEAFVGLLTKHFGLYQAAHIRWDINSEGKCEFRRGAMRFGEVGVIHEDQIQLIKQALIQNFARLMSESGAQVVTMGDHDYLVAATSLGASKTGGMMIWRQSKQLTLRSKGKLDEWIMQFWTKQMQMICLHIAKIQHTESMLYLDELTGVFNYRYLDIAIDGELRRLQRFKSPFCLLFIDLDNFKEVNDTFGHLSGSSVLKQVAQVIKSAVRDVDIVIRYGGDEYVVLLIGADIVNGRIAAERIRLKVATTVFIGAAEEPINLSTSIGVACCPDHGVERSTILRRADETMYISKRTGKNRVAVVGQTPVL
jgi:diguanylate cyclase (GGDEF)-like protein